jgi:hypothetical protein
MIIWTPSTDSDDLAPVVSNEFWTGVRNALILCAPFWLAVAILAMQGCR